MSLTNFEIISEITEIEIIAAGRKIRELGRLRRKYGPGRWRKLKVSRKYVSEAVEYAWPNCIGMKRTESVESK